MEETILVNPLNLNPSISNSKNFNQNVLISVPKNQYFTDFEELLKKDYLKQYFEEILTKLIYWDISPLPYEVVNFFVKNKENVVNLDESLIKNFKEINAIYQTVIKKENMCNNAVKIGSLNLLKAAFENGYSYIKYIDINTLDQDTFYCAITHGSLPCIEYLVEICKINIKYYYYDFEHYEQIYNVVANKGYIDVFCYLHKSKFGIEFARQTLDENEITDGALWSSNTVCAAAASGHLDIIEYLHKNSSQRDPYPTHYAALYGQLETLIYLNNNGYHWNSNTCSHAARGGHINILKYLHENGCPWTEYTCEEAVRCGYIDCFTYAHQNGCPMDQKIVVCAVINGKLNCLKYIIQNIGEEWKTKNITKFAAQYERLDCFIFLIEQGCPYDKEECLKVAKGECKQYILAN